MISYGNTVAIVNPAAQAGRAKAAISHVEKLLQDSLGDSFSLVFTQSSGHAIEIARNLSPNVGTVIALGGDGLVHEIANGLMHRPAKDRPALGVIPFGSGNDYAYSLGMSMKSEQAAKQLLSGRRVAVDVGCVNGVYFVETLSFGLDAAIALSTVDLRRKTGRVGTLLYAQAGIDQLLNHRKPMRYRAVLGAADGKSNDEERTNLEGEAFLFAVQIGPTYGGHFKICPDALIDDGLLDICMAHPPLSALSALGLFGLAKNGWHTGSKKIEFHTAKELLIDLDKPVATQADGERLEGTRFRITLEKHGLEAIMPSR